MPHNFRFYRFWKDLEFILTRWCQQIFLMMTVRPGITDYMSCQTNWSQLNAANFRESDLICKSDSLSGCYRRYIIDVRSIYSLAVKKYYHRPFILRPLAVNERSKHKQTWTTNGLLLFAQLSALRNPLRVKNWVCIKWRSWYSVYLLFLSSDTIFCVHLHLFTC